MPSEIHDINTSLINDIPKEEEEAEDFMWCYVKLFVC